MVCPSASVEGSVYFSCYVCRCMVASQTIAEEGTKTTGRVLRRLQVRIMRKYLPAGRKISHIGYDSSHTNLRRRRPTYMTTLLRPKHTVLLWPINPRRAPTISCRVAEGVVYQKWIWRFSLQHRTVLCVQWEGTTKKSDFNKPARSWERGTTHPFFDPCRDSFIH